MNLSTKIMAFLLLSISAIVHAGGVTLTNYMGTGENPRLYLTLSDNMPNWASFTVDYQQSGNIPYLSTAPNRSQWSTWIVNDKPAQQGHYYGTITLNATSAYATLFSYVGGENYYLEGLNFIYKNNTYELSVDKIIQVIPPDSGISPFP